MQNIVIVKILGNIYYEKYITKVTLTNPYKNNTTLTRRKNTFDLCIGGGEWLYLFLSHLQTLTFALDVLIISI